MQKYTDVVTSARSGAAIPDVKVTVKTHPGAVVATIYSDDGATTKANPLTTDENGEFSFYAADGDYTLTVSGTGITERTTGPITLLDPGDADATTLLATDVSFTQSGSGAASRTVQAKLREIVSVDDFDTVQEALTALSNGGILWGDKRDTVSVATGLTVPNSIRITGVKFQPAQNIICLTLNTDDIEIDHCEFDLSLQGTSNDTNRAISAVNRSTLRIHDNKFQDGAMGAYLDNCTNVWFDRNECDNPTSWHFYAYGGTDIKVRGNTCTNGTLDGLKFAGETTTSGVTRSLKNIVVTGNFCELNDRDGIDFASNECNNVLIDGNICVNNKLCSIEVKTIEHADNALTYSMRNVQISNNVCRNGSYTDNNQSLISCQSGAADFVLTTLGSQLFQDVRIFGNKIYTEVNSTNAYFAIRVAEVVSSLIENNQIIAATGTGGSIGLIRAHYGTSTVIRGNTINGAGITNACGISASSLGTANATTGVVITKNRVSSGASTNPVRITDAAVSGAQVYDNELFPAGTNGDDQYAIADTGTGTIYANNFRGFSTAIPSVRGFAGDYFAGTTQTAGYPEKWACVATGAPGTWQGMNQRGYRTNAGSPASSVTPIFAGEELFDSSNSDWWKAHGTANTNWTQLTN